MVYFLCSESAGKLTRVGKPGMMTWKFASQFNLSCDAGEFYDG